jgi:hypothetical protein
LKSHYCRLHGAYAGHLCPRCREANLTKTKARKLGSITHAIERLARLQTTAEMRRPHPDAQDQKIDAMIRACRAVLEEDTPMTPTLKLTAAPRAIQRRITARKHGGDDAASWAVFLDGQPFITGLTNREVPHYKEQAYQYLLKTSGPAPAPQPELAPEDRTRLQAIANQVWQEIGHDCLTAVQECAETATQRRNPTMTRDEVLEVVVDADRLFTTVQQELRRHGDEPARVAQCERLLAFLRAARYETVLATLRPGFGFARYGF